MKTPHTHTFNSPFSGLTGWAGTRKVKPIWILLKQETVSGSGISWVICKSASHSRQITMPVPHHSKFFFRPDALPAAQPTASKHWRHQPGKHQKGKIQAHTILCTWFFNTLKFVHYWQSSNELADGVVTHLSVMPLLLPGKHQERQNTSSTAWPQNPS